MLLAMLLLNGAVAWRLAQTGGDLRAILGRMAPGLLAGFLLVLVMENLRRRFRRMGLELREEGLFLQRGRRVQAIPWAELRRIRMRGPLVVLEGRGQRLVLSVGLLEQAFRAAGAEPTEAVGEFLRLLRERAPQAAWFPESLREGTPPT
jgi:hypothetical protein